MTAMFTGRMWYGRPYHGPSDSLLAARPRATPNVGARGKELHIPLGRPGTCPVAPQLHVCLYDDSGSMTGGNDSAALRYEESSVAVGAVARRCRCDRELVAVMHLNSPSDADRGPTPLRTKGAGSVLSGLRVPHDSDGASLLRATLDRARELVSAHPDHEATLTVFSDFELFDDHLPGLWQELGSFPADVTAVVMRAEPPAELLADARVRVVAIPGATAPGPLARTLFDTLVRHRPDSRPSPGASRDDPP